MPRTDVTQMLFSQVYPLLVQKAQRKGRTREEVAQVTAWLTGYSPGWPDWSSRRSATATSSVKLRP